MAERQTAKSYQDLRVWRRGIDLVEVVYAVVRQFPRSEDYGLAAQLRRAVVSVPANIAQGFGRATGRDFANFLSIARGSLMETETLLMIATRLSYVSDRDIAESLSIGAEVGRMITVLRQRVTASPAEAQRLRERASGYELYSVPPVDATGGTDDS